MQLPRLLHKQNFKAISLVEVLVVLALVATTMVAATQITVTALVRIKENEIDDYVTGLMVKVLEAAKSPQTLTINNDLTGLNDFGGGYILDLNLSNASGSNPDIINPSFRQQSVDLARLPLNSCTTSSPNYVEIPNLGNFKTPPVCLQALVREVESLGSNPIYEVTVRAVYNLSGGAVERELIGYRRIDPDLAIVPTKSVPVCGDGKKEGLEQCDDGNTNSVDSCTNFCTFDLPARDDGVCKVVVVYNPCAQGNGCFQSPAAMVQSIKNAVPTNATVVSYQDGISPKTPQLADVDVLVAGGLAGWDNNQVTVPYLPMISTILPQYVYDNFVGGMDVVAYGDGTWHNTTAGHPTMRDLRDQAAHYITNTLTSKLGLTYDVNQVFAAQWQTTDATGRLFGSGLKYSTDASTITLSTPGSITVNSSIAGAQCNGFVTSSTNTQKCILASQANPSNTAYYTVTSNAYPLIGTPALKALFKTLKATDCVQAPAPPPSCNIVGTVNSYYPGVGNVASGTTNLQLGAVVGTNQIAAGDRLLVIQMQGADIYTSNDANYGAGVGTGRGYIGSSLIAGKYEYVRAIAAGGVGNRTIAVVGTKNGGLVNSYVDSVATGRTYQIIKVAGCAGEAILTGDVTAPAWNGRTGGIIAFDAQGDMDLRGYRLDVKGKGFRGGGLIAVTYTTDFFAGYDSATRGGFKAEGIAGASGRLFDGTAIVIPTTGKFAGGTRMQGAPANSGGGGNESDCGGGGGGGASIGGLGGGNWTGTNNLCGGLGGIGSPTNAVWMGGGGGGGQSTNGTGTSGAQGGGAIFLRVGAKLSGPGILNADGNSVGATGPDSGGGGGGGGSIMVFVGGTQSGNVSMSATGGKGGDSTNNFGSQGGGGAGGTVLYSNTVSPQLNITGGAGGLNIGPGGGAGTRASSGGNGRSSTNLIESNFVGCTMIGC